MFTEDAESTHVTRKWWEFWLWVKRSLTHKLMRFGSVDSEINIGGGGGGGEGGGGNGGAL